MIVIKCHTTGREFNAINDYLDILSILTSRLVEPPVIDYISKTWMYKDLCQDSSDNESDDESNENEKLLRDISEDELEAIILFILFNKLNSYTKMHFYHTDFEIMFRASK